MNQPAPQLTTTPLTFTQLFSSSRRGARLTRLLGVSQLHSWGISQDLTERAEIVIAELAANAVVHGRLPGRSFRLTLVYDAPAGRLRIDVTDARGDRWPVLRRTPYPRKRSMPTGAVSPLSPRSPTTGRRSPYPLSGKTVRAELTGPGWKHPT